MPITKLVAVPVSTARSFALAGTQVRSVEIAGGYDEIEAVTRRQATSDNGPVDRRTTLAVRFATWVMTGVTLVILDV